MANAYVEIDDLELTPDEYLAYTGYSELGGAVEDFKGGNDTPDGEIAYQEREPFRQGIDVLREMNRKFGFPDKNGAQL